MRYILALLVLSWVATPQIASARQRSGVVLHISVRHALVLVDGDQAVSDAGQQVRLRLRPGSHLVRVEHAGFLPFEQKVRVKRHAFHRIEILLKLAPPPAPPPAPKPAPAPPPKLKVDATRPPPSPPVARPIRVAVYQVKAGPGIDRRTVAVVTDSILAEMRKLDRISAIGMQEIGDMLSFEQKKQLLGCNEDSCLAEIAGAMGVDELVTSSVSTLGDSRLFTIRRIDMAHASVKGSVTKRLVASNGEEMLAAIGPGIQQLYPEYSLRPGAVRGVSKAVAARLNPPPLPRWAFFTAAGATAAAALVGGYFAVQFQSAQNQHDSLAKQAETQVVSASELQSAGRQAVSRAQSANIAFGVTAGLAVTTGVIALFTDWHGYRSANSSQGSDSKVALRLAPGGLMVSWR